MSLKRTRRSAEAKAGNDGEADQEAFLAALRQALRSRSPPAAVLDFTVYDLRRRFPNYDWTGVYAVEESELVLRAWSGERATQHVRIPVGQGICGLAARTRETVIVGDVSKDPRYLECFPDTRSEIVVPILKGGTAIGEIDIDSKTLDAFRPKDRAFLERVAAELAAVL